MDFHLHATIENKTGEKLLKLDFRIISNHFKQLFKDFQMRQNTELSSHQPQILYACACVVENVP